MTSWGSLSRATRSSRAAIRRPIHCCATLSVSMEGVYISHAFGASFKRIGPEPPTSAVRIDFDGDHLYFARGYPDRLRRVALDGSRMSVIALPEREETDFVAYIAQNPVQSQELAIGTRRRNIFVSPGRRKDMAADRALGRCFVRRPACRRQRHSSTRMLRASSLTTGLLT